MNSVEKYLAKLPYNEITIRTTINSLSVIERIEFGVLPVERKRQRTQYYSFEGSYHGNYFKIQGHLINPDGSDVFPKAGYISIGFIGFPLGIESSPAFYGKVFDSEEGSIINGHFAIPFSFILLLVVLLVIYLGRVFPGFYSFSTILSMFLLLWSFSSLFEYFIERKAIIDFLKGLLFDVIKEKDES